MMQIVQIHPSFSFPYRGTVRSTSRYGRNFCSVMVCTDTSDNIPYSTIQPVTDYTIPSRPVTASIIVQLNTNIAPTTNSNIQSLFILPTTPLSCLSFHWVYFWCSLLSFLTPADPCDGLEGLCRVPRSPWPRLAKTFRSFPSKFVRLYSDKN